MIKPILAAAALSILVPSAAWAVPAALPSPQVGAQSSDLLRVGKATATETTIKSVMERKIGTGGVVTLIGIQIGFGVGIGIRIGHTTGGTVAA